MEKIDKNKKAHDDIPASLDGEILIRRVYDRGLLVGIISVDENIFNKNVIKKDQDLKPAWLEIKKKFLQEGLM